MTTIDPDQLPKITGGIMSRTRGLNSEAYNNICTGKDFPAQLAILKQRMTSNSSNAPGVRKEVIDGIEALCFGRKKKRR